MLEKILLRFGYVKLPKVKDGQYLRHPTVCKNPVRKPKRDGTKEIAHDFGAATIGDSPIIDYTDYIPF